MAKSIGKNTVVAYLNEDHPAANAGAGFYEVLQDNEHNQELDENGDSKSVEITNTDVEFGEKLAWQKNNPDPEGEPANPENNEGKFVYASSLSDDEEATQSANGNDGGDVNG
jgi:hypothetical protein